MSRLRASRLLPALLLAGAACVALRNRGFATGKDEEQGAFQYPETTVKYDTVHGFERRIVAVGDLHGDYGNALKVLEMAGVVNENGSWTGDVDYFVQTGDIIDRWVHRYVALFIGCFNLT